MINGRISPDPTGAVSGAIAIVSSAGASVTMCR